MGRMKDKFIEEQEKLMSENTMEWEFGPNNEPKDSCCGCGGCNENAADYDAWWDSLTDDQKEQLFKDRDASEREMLDQIADEDFYGPNKTAGV